MNQRFIMFRRAGVFYCEDTTTGKQKSLRTRDQGEALTLLHAKNESFRQPVLNRQIARAYLTASDPQIAKRTWQNVMDEIPKLKSGSTRDRWETAIKSKAFDSIRNLPVLETQAEHFLRVLEGASVSANSFLRRIHGFALDMDWLPWPVLPRRATGIWPAISASRYCFNPRPAHVGRATRTASISEPELRSFNPRPAHVGRATAASSCD